MKLRLLHTLLHNHLSSPNTHTLTPHTHTHTNILTLTPTHSQPTLTLSHDSVTFMEVNNRQVEKFIYDVTATIYGGVEPGRTECSHNCILGPLVAPLLCSRHCSPAWAFRFLNFIIPLTLVSCYCIFARNVLH